MRILKAINCVNVGNAYKVLAMIKLIKITTKQYFLLYSLKLKVLSPPLERSVGGKLIDAIFASLLILDYLLCITVIIITL
jgi:hypothetical protein